MTPSPEQLLAIARNYWRADKVYHSRTDSSPEHLRLCARWAEALKQQNQWWTFLDDLKQRLPGFTLGDATATPDACFRCAVYFPPGDTPRALRVVVGCVSILAPIYTLYGVEYALTDARRHDPRVYFEPLPSEMRHTAEIVARRLEATFGMSALPRDLATIPIPLFVEPLEPPDTTLFHALFTSEPASLP